MIVSIETVTLFGQGFNPEFRLPGFSPNLLGGPYLFLKDLVVAGVLGAVCVALYRWILSHPRRLIGFAPAEARYTHHSHTEALVILVFIFLLMLTDLIYYGGRLVWGIGNSGIQAERNWSPVSGTVGSLVAPLGGDVAKFLSDASWWIHLAVILVFMNLLPRSKHFHVITAIPNVFFGKLEPPGALSSLDLEKAESFGVSHIDQFNWKQVLDMYSCTECGRCSSHCPATLTGKSLAPRQLLLDLRDYLYQHQSEVIAKRLDGKESDGEVGDNIVGERLIADDVLWACTSCRACEEACPVAIEYVDKIVDMRRHLVQEEARFPGELNRTFKAMEVNGSPWGLGKEKRAELANDLGIPFFQEKAQAEYLLFVGCAGAFDDRARKTTASLVRVLKEAGVDFAVLGADEPCNGETARRLGNEYLFQTMAAEAIGIFEKQGVQKIITHCPHCFNTLKNEYPQFGGHYVVIHTTELLSQLEKEGKIRLKNPTDKKITFHDPCYLGRYNGVYDPPRDLLQKIPGIHLAEMERHKRTAMCCGAGGGRMWLEEDPHQRVNNLRVEQALQTSPDTVAVSCPYCMIMLEDGVKAKGCEDSIQVRDVVELVDQALGNSHARLKRI
jgi:Fe-S oxidoreductase